MTEKRSFRGWSTPTADVPKDLALALQWLEIDQGRAQDYVRLCSEFSQKGNQSREHFLAYNEVCALLAIYHAWKDTAASFPNITSRIRQVFTKGPLLADDENPGSATNKARSMAFEFILSGKLLHVHNIKVLSVDGIPNSSLSNVPIDPLADIPIEWNEIRCNIECKRPLTAAGLARCVDEALGQIKDPSRIAKNGIVALDLSQVMRKKDFYFQGDSHRAVEERLQSELHGYSGPIIESIRDEKILGIIGYVRIPYTVPEVSSILDPNGHPCVVRVYSGSACVWRFVKNHKSPYHLIMDELNEGFSSTRHDIPEQLLPLK